MLDNNYEPSSRKSKKSSKRLKGPQNLNLSKVMPLTKNQTRFFDNYKRHDIMVLHGFAGTGKTYIALYNALYDVVNGDYDGVVICRSSVPSRDVGFLPGNEQEKMKVYEAPYQAMVNMLFNRGDAYECLKAKKHVEFMSTSFVRGITIDNKIIIVDEMQNLSFEELDSIITRVGKNSKIIFCGDYSQTDLKKREQDGLDKFLDILELIEEVGMIEFEISDIVRSGLVKKYLIAKEQLND